MEPAREGPLSITREEALAYHAKGRPGKLKICPTKSTRTQEDLSFAYSPGVAEPCREIARDTSEVFRYTARGNLVAVVTNGSAVLGLGNIGDLASKPVMEGKAVYLQALRRHRRLRHRDRQPGRG
jgi:malate dehydrogenase (oxaloacetate-decarboxylating)(NADP+)